MRLSLIACVVILFMVGRGVAAPVARGEISFAEQSERLGGLQVGVYWGVSVADCNGDGYEDVLFGRHRAQPPSLAINDGTGAFTIPPPVLLTPPSERDRHAPQWIDFDNDGDMDIFWGSGLRKPHELWQNDGSGLHYVDLWLGVDPKPYPSGASRQGLFFDWNGDAYLDLFHIFGRSGPSAFAENLSGSSIFLDRTEDVGLGSLPDTENHGHGGGAPCDFDNDGEADFFLCTARLGREAGPAKDDDIHDTFSKLYRQTEDGQFVDVLPTALGTDAAELVADARWGDYDNDGDMDLYLARGIMQRDYGRQRNGDGVHLMDSSRVEFFSRVNARGDAQDGFSVNLAGATTVTLEPTEAFRRFIPALEVSGVFLGQAAVHPTTMPVVFTVSDPAMSGTPVMSQSGIYLWLDSGGTRLQVRHVALAAPARSPAKAAKAAQHAAPADPLDCDEMVERSSSKAGSRKQGSAYVSGYISVDTGQLTSPQTIYMEGDAAVLNDFLFRNNGDGTFTDVTAELGIDNVSDSVSAAWGDFDNDGDLDLLVLNYHYGVPANRPFVLYRNDGPAGFVDVAATAGFLSELNSVVTSLAVADYDLDGDLDFVIAHEQGPPPRLHGQPRYYVNQYDGKNRWLEVRLVGTVSNRDAIGAKLWLTTDAGVQYREQTGGFHVYAQDSMVVHFGTGLDAVVDLTIRWPTGAVQTLSDVPTNQRITVVEPER
ncbi:MAG: CRTAC1 family protein [Planctomycetota bacterium]